MPACIAQVVSDSECSTERPKDLALTTDRVAPAPPTTAPPCRTTG